MSFQTDHIFVSTTAPNSSRSKTFYERLGFKMTTEGSNFYTYSDSQSDIFINMRTSARLGYVLFTDHVEELRHQFEHVTFYEAEDGLVTADPNGVRLFIYPKKLTPQIDRTNLLDKNLCGNYYGSGIESTQIISTWKFWKSLGYQTKDPIDETTSYATLNREHGPSITLFKPGICPHAFYNPSLTYFNGKKGNPIVIENLQNAGVRIVEEITAFNPAGEVDNIIISDPAGLHSFIFNDG